MGWHVCKCYFWTFMCRKKDNKKMGSILKTPTYRTSTSVAPVITASHKCSDSSFQPACIDGWIHYTQSRTRIYHAWRDGTQTHWLCGWLHTATPRYTRCSTRSRSRHCCRRQKMMTLFDLIEESWMYLINGFRSVINFVSSQHKANSHPEYSNAVFVYNSIVPI